MSKIFEKLILQRIIEIEDLNGVDLTGVKQHGFKRRRSTSTAGLELQSEIARALDSNKFTLMASLDLSSAFDIVNVNLLLKRLSIVGLPTDVINLIPDFQCIKLQSWTKPSCKQIQATQQYN